MEKDNEKRDRRRRTLSRYIFDLECDGFLAECTRIHSLVLQDVDTGEIISCSDRLQAKPFAAWGLPIEVGLKILGEADVIIGHNVIGFDIPVINKLVPGWTYRGKVIDTLIMARCLYPDLRKQDFPRYRRDPELFPVRLVNSHALKAWGIRLGVHKIQYEHGFDNWSPEMQIYCEQDVITNRRLFRFLEGSKRFTATTMYEWLDYEMELGFITSQIERNGFPIDVMHLEKLETEIRSEMQDLKRKLQDQFGTVRFFHRNFTPKRDNKTLGYKEGVIIKQYKEEKFNPTSRRHVAKILVDEFGWVPLEFGKDKTKDGVKIKGDPKLDDDLLEALGKSIPEAEEIRKVFFLNKRLAQIATGYTGWLKMCKTGDDGIAKIHHRINTNGAATARATHSSPNLAQVPAPRSEMGTECRQGFTVPPGWSLVGCDLSGIELRCLAHYMAAWDKGAYGDKVLEEDIHVVNQMAAGIPKQLYTTTEGHEADKGRDDAKTFIYAFIYGAGNAKLGSILKPTSTKEQQTAAGTRMRTKFLKTLPALKTLIETVKEKAGYQGYIKGIDGRIIEPRSSHSALNFLLQSCGAIVSKRWIIEFVREMDARGYKHGWDGQYCILAWVHDEIQVAVRHTMVEELGEAMVQAALTAGENLGIRIPTDAEYNYGRTWADTH